MQDKRRHKRVKITVNLVISTVFNQSSDNIFIESPIEVKDISKSGLGFISKSILPMGYYFNAQLNLGSEDSTLYCVVKIIRCEALEDNEYFYGCEFVGMAPVFDYVFEEYAKSFEA